MEEIWKVIEYATNYSISNFGMVKNNNTNVILKPYITKNNYEYIWIKHNKDNKFYNSQVHRLVAIAFVPHEIEKNVVNHKDYNRRNNCANNLEWITQKENVNYSRHNMSKGHKGKKRSKHEMMSITKGHFKNPNHNISKKKNIFVFSIQHNGIIFRKSFLTKQDAISYRDNYLKENGYYE